jgi:hypothetical protein
MRLRARPCRGDNVLDLENELESKAPERRMLGGTTTEASFGMYPYHHPGAQRILELPVYRCTEEQHYRDQKCRCDAAVQPIKQSLQTVPNISPERVAQELEDFRNSWLQREEYMWDFNEVVGWIRLYARAGSIGASLFVVNQRVSKSMVRKRFVWDSSNFLVMSVYENQSNSEIFRNLKELVIDESHSRFKGRRYIDIGVLDIIGPHLDWAALTRRAAPHVPALPS